jgi:hypothetical protein
MRRSINATSFVLFVLGYYNSAAVAQFDFSIDIPDPPKIDVPKPPQGVYNGDWDPTNRNNHLPFHIETPFRPPVLIREPMASGLAVMSYKVDGDGWIWESTRSDRDFVKTQARAKLRHYPDGNAYWEYGGKKYPADNEYDDKARMADIRNQKIANQRRRDEEQARNRARAILQDISISLLRTDPNAIAQQLANRDDASLDALIRMNSVRIRDAGALGVQDPRGFQLLENVAMNEHERRVEFRRAAEEQRLAQLAEMQQQMAAPADPVAGAMDEEQYAANFGMIYVAERLPTGFWGLRITRYPPQDSPAGAIGLEPGDLIFAIEGRPIRGEQDVLGLAGPARLRLINIRTAQPQDQDIELQQ